MIYSVLIVIPDSSSLIRLHLFECYFLKYFSKSSSFYSVATAPVKALLRAAWTTTTIATVVDSHLPYHPIQIHAHIVLAGISLQYKSGHATPYHSFNGSLLHKGLSPNFLR